MHKSMMQLKFCYKQTDDGPTDKGILGVGCARGPDGANKTHFHGIATLHWKRFAESADWA